MGLVGAARPGVATRFTLIIATVLAALTFGVAGASADVSNVTVTPNTTSAGATEAAYTIEFTTPHTLSGDAQTPDTITVDFPTGFQLSSGFGVYYVTVNLGEGDQNEAYATTATTSNNGTEVTITVPSGLSADADSTVEIQAYGVSNPSSAASNQSVSVSTSQDTSVVASPTFEIGSATQVSNASMSENTTAAGATRAVLTATFTASEQGAVSDGGVVSGSDGYVQITAPAGVSFAGVDNSADIEVIDGSYDSGPGGADGDYFAVDPSDAGENVIDVISPGIEAGDTVTIHIHGASNPGSAQGGTGYISTSSDVTPSDGISLNTTAASEIGDASLTTLSDSANATTVSDEITFTANQALSGNFSEYDQQSGGFIELTAPAGTVFPHGAPDGDNDFDYVLVDDTTSSPAYDIPTAVVNPGGAAGDNVVEIEVPNGVNISANDQVTLDVYDVTNPTAADADGTMQVSTSSDTVVDSLAQPIGDETGPSAVSTNESSSTPAASNVTYTVGLTSTHGLTSADPNEGDGAESGGVAADPLANPISFVTINAAGATFPSDPSDYTIADTTSSQSGEPANVTVLQGGGAEVQLPYYPSFSVAAGDQVSITVQGVTNAPGNVGISNVSTTSDPGTVAPSVPTDVQATPGNASATVTWAAASVSGLTSYLVTPYIGTTPQTPFTTSGTGTTATIAGLSNGTAYTFTVAAITSAGTGTESAHSSPVTPEPPSTGAPAFGESTAAINFGSVGVGVTSAESTVKITNTGSAALSISAVSLTGSEANEFTISSDGCAGQSLASAASCTVAVTFKPSGTGTQSASLSFTDNASGSPHSVALSGTGTSIGSVSGTVKDASGKAVSGASISICPEGANGINLSSSACQDGTSHSDGSYQFAGLTPGQWDIQVEPSSSSLFPGSAIVSVQAGSNTQNFALAAPKGLPSGYTFDGPDGVSTSGVPTLNWEEPFSFTFPYSIPAGKPNTETALVETASMSPTGSTDEADQPTVSGSAVLLVSYDASDHPTLESVQSDPESGPDPQFATQKASSSSDLRRGGGPAATTANSDLTTNLVMTEGNLEAVNNAVIGGALSVTSSGLSAAFHGGAEVTINGKTAFNLPPGSTISIVGNKVIITTPNNQPIQTCPPTTNSNFRSHLRPHDSDSCPVPPPPSGGFDDYTDPAGTVKTTAGAPVPGARVTLSRSATKKGKFKKVPNKSTIMSASNRRNPSVTTAGGLFNWDTLPGFYKVAATRSGCRTTAKSSSKALQVPPPALGIGLVLRCPKLTRSKTHVKISAKKLQHSGLVELLITVRGAKKHAPTGAVKLSINGKSLVTAPLGRKATLVWDSNASSTKTVGAAYLGDGYNKPSHASGKVE